MTGQPANPADPAGTVAAYDAIADEWDRGLGSRSPQFAARMRREIVRLLQPAAGGGLALELGAGTGWLLDATSPLFKQLRAIEPSAGMLEICWRRIESGGLRNAHADAGDAMLLNEIAEATVDAIYAVGLLDAVPEPARVLAASHRVLKPGGILVVATANGDCPWHTLRDRLLGKDDARTGRYLTASQLVGLADDAGMKPIEVRTWGATPPRLAAAPAVVMLDTLERIATAAGLSRYLAILTASFVKPTSATKATKTI